MMEIKDKIKGKTLELGFDLAGVTAAAPVDESHCRHFRDWLGQGSAGGMEYLGRNIEKRFAPADLLDGARSVVCVALNYKPSQDVPAEGARVADYALYEDYHEFIKARLSALAEFITQSAAEKNIRFKICVDSVPLAERALAQRAGLGWIGKHHGLIHPTLGGQLLLGELITTLELAADAPFEKDLCGDCEQCLRACPTGALSGTGNFDGRKCISYLTIEEKGDIPPEFAAKIGNRLFGCDECVSACPYQAAAPVCANKEFQFFPQRRVLQPEQILNWTQADFEQVFKSSAVERLGSERLNRNARICQWKFPPGEV
jgi:epoxyqueuosine reductase